MQTKIETFNASLLKTDIPDIRSGDTVQVHQRIKEGDKERIQVFEGLVLARKHGRGVNATITVRKVSQGVGIERIFPIHSPMIAKIEIVKRSKVRKAKLYYLRTAKGKKAKLKAKEFNLEKPEEPAPVMEETKPEETTPKEQPQEQPAPEEEQKPAGA